MNRKNEAPAHENARATNSAQKITSKYSENISNKQKKIGGFIIKESDFRGLHKFNNEEFGLLIRSICNYHFYQKESNDLPEKVNAMFDFLISYSDELKSSYMQKCEQSSRNAKKRWEGE